MKNVEIIVFNNLFVLKIENTREPALSCLNEINGIKRKKDTNFE